MPKRPQSQRMIFQPHSLVDSRVEDSESIQVHILFIFRITTTLVGIKASQRFNQASKKHHEFNDIVMVVERVEALLEKGKTRIRNFGRRSTIVSSTPHNGRLNQSFVRSSGAKSSAQVSTNKNPYTLNVIPKYYRCGESGHKSNIYPKHGMINLADSIEEETEHEEPNIEGEVEEILLNLMLEMHCHIHLLRICGFRVRFLPKIRTLWIQAHILFIFRITTDHESLAVTLEAKYLAHLFYLPPLSPPSLSLSLSLCDCSSSSLQFLVMVFDVYLLSMS
ncbi:unnamed protein product [Spirodela intermedia]|uniref:Uncharacterized protein n=1 Tax=Spirodela intermedia TaxID=51605 RepID=A0A7I8JFI0_SPIIN|nr:unnamed protein product [Spirodela intermedia]CAA6668897.1 unnamed protein product [Spirodela intermedia]